MKSNRWMAGMLVALVLAGCTREQADERSLEGQELTFEAAMVGEETRTALQADGISVWWTVNESVNVFYGSQFEGKFTSTNTVPAAVTQFKGALTAMTGTVETIEDEANAYWAVYPFDEANTCDGSGVVLGVPDIQMAAEGTFADHFFPAIAKSSGLNLAFYHVCGGIRFSVVSEGIKSVTVKGNNGEKLAGKVKVTFDADGHPAVASVLDGKTEVTVNAPGGGSFEVGKHYFIALLPQALSKGFTMSFTNASMTRQVSRDKSVTINRSRFGIVDGLDEGLFDDIVTIILETPGTLGAKIDERFASRNDTMGLRIIGEMDTDDVSVLNRLNNLWYLDLRESGAPKLSITYHRSLQYLYLPDTMTEIGNTAFASCGELLYVHGAAVTKVGERAFSSCSKLEDYYLPEVESIGAGGFSSCSSLTKLIFKKLTELGSASFSGCSSVVEVSLDALEELTSQQLRGNRGADQIEVLNLPSLIILHDAEFESQKNLKRLYLPSVTSVGRHILGSSSVEELILSSLEVVSNSAFYRSESLRRVEIPSAVTIDNEAFAFCRNLSDVIAPKAVTLGERAFGTCSLEGELDFSSVVTIGASCFSESTGIGSIHTAAFPEATEIGSGAFSKSPNTVSVDIPKALTISANAFSGCSSLVHLSEGNVLPTTKLGRTAFYNCSSLSKLDFPALIELDGSMCFHYTGLTVLKFGVLNWKATDEYGAALPPFEFWSFPIGSNSENISLYLGVSPFPKIADADHPWWKYVVEYYTDDNKPVYGWRFMGHKWASVNDYQ